MQTLTCAFIANNTGPGSGGLFGDGEPGSGTSAVLVCTSSSASPFATWSTDIPIGQADPQYPGRLSPFPSQFSNASPSVASFGGKLWVAFIASDGSNNILLCFSSDGVAWSHNIDIRQASNGSAPSLAVYGGALWVAFIANNASNNVLVCSSPNGTSWDGKNTDIGQASNGSGPSLTPEGLYDGQVSNGGQLYVAFLANDDGKNILVCSNDGPGTQWSQNIDIGQASLAAPAIAMFDNFKFVAKS